jgi:bifunctional non-homologous end joining protein LigD
VKGFAQTQAASDGSRDIELIYFAFDLLHLDGRDTSGLTLGERSELLAPVIAGAPVSVQRSRDRRRRDYRQACVRARP